MVPMRLGRRLALPAAALAVVVPTLTGCALIDLVSGSTIEEAFEYLPANTFSVRFVDRAAMAEHLEVDDVDPRDLSDSDIDDFAEPQLTEDAAVATAISGDADAMKDAPINDFDIEWEADARWGDDPARPAGSAYVWKVGDDVDFDDLAEDLEDKGYEKSLTSDLPIYSVDLSAADPETGLVGGVYPLAMHTVLLAEGEQVVAAGHLALDALGEVAEVIADDADSLADDGGMNDLLDPAEGDPVLALLRTGDVCRDLGRPLPRRLLATYEDLGRPDARALFITVDDDPEVLLALKYPDEDAAEDDLELREALVEDGVEPRTRRSFDDLGVFELEHDGEFVLIVEENLDGGTSQAVQAEDDGGGPGFCVPEDRGAVSRGA